MMEKLTIKQQRSFAHKIAALERTTVNDLPECWYPDFYDFQENPLPKHTSNKLLFFETIKTKK